jgi:hypothetical protein
MSCVICVTLSGARRSLRSFPSSFLHVRPGNSHFIAAGAAVTVARAVVLESIGADVAGIADRTAQKA